MAFVVRFSRDIEKDIKRGWSAFMGGHGSDLRAILDEAHEDELNAAISHALSALCRENGVEFEWDDEGSLVEALLADGIEQDEINAEIQSAMEDVAEDNGLIFDDGMGEWRTFHHFGLSCFGLEAETETEAIAEAHTRSFGWVGDGDATVGSVRVVGKVSGTDDAEANEYLWILECDGFRKED